MPSESPRLNSFDFSEALAADASDLFLGWKLEIFVLDDIGFLIKKFYVGIYHLNKVKENRYDSPSYRLIDSMIFDLGSVTKKCAKEIID